MRRLNLLYLAGLLVMALGLMAKPAPSLAAYKELLYTINTGNLNQPAKVAVDPSNGDVYVTDAGNKKVKKYDKNGNYISGFNLSVGGTPVGITVNANNIFIGDDTNNCVWIYNKSGVLANLTYTTANKLGDAAGRSTVKMPNTISVAPSGHIFVVDGDSDKVLIYESTGLYNNSFGTSGNGTSTGTTIYLYFPSGLTFANSTPSGAKTVQYFYIGDQGNNRVQKLYYEFYTNGKSIVTYPTYSQTIGTKGDAFGQFLRLSDLAWDSVYSRLTAVDSLQMVGQLFDTAGATLNEAFNYSGSAVQGYLNVPTASATDVTNRKIYIASNQADQVSVFDIAIGSNPTITVTSPAAIGETPGTATYGVNFNVNDSDGASCTVKLYYYNEATPSNKILFSTSNHAISGGTASGSATWDLVGAYPNFITAGTYKIYAEVLDDTSNQANGTSPGSVTIVAVSGNYTDAMQAKYGAAAGDYDGDGVSNADETNGTQNTLFGNAPTDLNDPDSDNDGLDDGVELGVKAVNTNLIVPLASGATVHTNPNAADTDNGGVSDIVEIVKGTDPNAGVDDLVVASSPQDLVSDYIINQPPFQRVDLTVYNNSASNCVIDVAFYNTNGTLASTVPAAAILAPGQSYSCDPYVAYGFTEGSVEVRATTADVIGDIVRFRTKYSDTREYDSADTCQMWRPGDKASKLMAALYYDYPDASWRYRGYVYIKNWSDVPANVTAKFFKDTDGTSATTNRVLGGHEVWLLRPSSVTTFALGSIEVISDVPVTANHFMERWNATDANVWDIGADYPLAKSTSAVSYGPMWYDTATWRYVGFIYLVNPSDTETINATVTVYGATGAVLATQNYPAMAPHTMVYFRPSLVGATEENLGWFKVESTGGDHLSCSYMQRYRSGCVPCKDWAVFGDNYQASATTWKAIKYTDYAQPTQETDDVRYCTWLYVVNPNATPLNISVEYYNQSGGLVATVAKTVDPNKQIYWEPITDGGPNIGHAKIISTNGLSFLATPLTQHWNYIDNTYKEFGFSKRLW